MALFPAYADITAESKDDDQVRWDVNVHTSQLSMEAQLLASDTEDEINNKVQKVNKLVRASEKTDNEDFYMDCKMDCGNLRVSTLYYPGRPQYDYGSKPLGSEKRDTSDRKRRRYYKRRVADDCDAVQVAERAASFRRLLEETPRDIALWEKYIDFMERCSTEQEAVAAAELAVERSGHSRRLRARLYAALRTSLAPQAYAERLRNLLTSERKLEIRLEIWIELMHALGTAPEGGTNPVTVVAGAALADMRALPGAYPDLLYHFGLYIRAGGLWEQLVQLIELIAAMNYPKGDFPPPADREKRLQAEQRLRDIEDKAIDSGLPLSAVWVRVERARAATHWRPASDHEDDNGDPQRRPLPHDVAELLQPVVDPHQLFRLSVRMLMLAKVPLMYSGWSHASLGFCGQCVEELLPLVGEARLLPHLHPAHASPALAQKLLGHFMDPPHYFADDQGYLTWVSSLWEICCTWASGAKRTGLVCWRLRWLRALVLAGEDGQEARRLRAEGRALLKRMAGGSPLPFAEWARLEKVVTGTSEGALRAARHALRAALADADTPHHHLLYMARVVCEVSDDVASGGAAMVAAILKRSSAIDNPPQTADLQLALQRCEEQCEALEQEFQGDEEGMEGDEEWALLPSRAEWGVARAWLASPSRRAVLLKILLERPYVGDNAEAARYWEQSAVILAAVSKSSAVARALSLHYPNNHYLAIAGAGAPLWGGSGVRASGGRGQPRGGGLRALADLLPLLLRALDSDWAPQESDALARAARRILNSGAGVEACGPLGAALRLEAEARAARPRLPHALYKALAAAPQHKWLHVRGAAWCGGEAAALADMLLDKLLRLHALPNELLPLETSNQPENGHAIGKEMDKADQDMGEEISVKADHAIEENISETDHAMEEEITKADYALKDNISETHHVIEDEITESGHTMGKKMRQDDHAMDEEIEEADHMKRNTEQVHDMKE